MVSTSKTTLLIVDDHTLIRQVWTFVLNADPRFSVIGGCGRGEEVLALVNSLRPDVILMDINLPGMNGIEATELILRHVPNARILGASMQTQPQYARKMLQSGAMGYITKNSSSQEMFQAILEIRNGKRYICPNIKTLLSEQMIFGETEEDRLNLLTKRELEVVKMIRRGFTSREIGNEMNISEKTAEVHRYNIMKKLNLKNTPALVNFVNRHLLSFQ